MKPPLPLKGFDFMEHYRGKEEEMPFLAADGPLTYFEGGRAHMPTHAGKDKLCT